MVGRRLLALAGVLGCLLGAAAGAVGAAFSEYEVKAAYLYNFSRYVEWPPEVLDRGGGTITVCVLGEDPFGPVLERTLTGKTVADRRLVLRRTDTLSDAARCHIVFVAASEEDALSEIVRTARNAGILTVGETDDFARRGGMIQLVRQASNVRFAINLGAIERAGLKISSEVLKLATDVIR
jgi:hypothetical protein